MTPLLISTYIFVYLYDILNYHFMRIGLIGLGLIGGSMVIDLRRRGFAKEITGMDADSVNAEAALRMGIVDRLAPLKELVAASDLIIIAIPAGAAVKLLNDVLDIFAEEGESCRKVVMDVCSVKDQLVSSVHYHSMRRRYVPSHPMAGTEYCGPWAALSGLFDGKAGIICDASESDIQAVKLVEKVYDTLNMRVIHMNSSSHDVHTAYVSHLSHVISFALARTVLHKEKSERHIFDLASGGFSSTVRLAKSNSAMWTPIFLQNSSNLVPILDDYIAQIQEFRNAIAEYDDAKVKEMIDESNKIRRIIK